MIRKLADEWDDEDEDTEHETLNEIIPKVDKEVRIHRYLNIVRYIYYMYIVCSVVIT